MTESTNKSAVVTGANKGIGFEIVRQLASKGITAVLTARDEKRGLETVEKLKASGLSDLVLFRKLDVTDPASVSSLAEFVKTQFRKLDILVNNAAIQGAIVDDDALSGFVKDGVPVNWDEIATESDELVKKCLDTNYYGAKRMCEALIPFLQLSNAPRIINVSSRAGKLQYIKNEWAMRVLSDVENLSEETVDAVVSEYLNAFKEGSLETKSWPVSLSAYRVSKAAMNAYTRILAKRCPIFRINCICPGYVKTDMTKNTGMYTVEEGAQGPVWLAMLPNDGPSGLFFSCKEEISFNYNDPSLHIDGVGD